MALVTQADVDLVVGTQNSVAQAGGKIADLHTLLGKVFVQIDLAEPMTAGTDFADITAAYIDDYDAALAELKLLAESLPRWNQV